MVASIRKTVVLILDGLGDLPVPALSARTPLEAARTPVLDRLASSGLHGLVDPERAGKTPNTHTGCGTLLGVPPAFDDVTDLLPYVSISNSAGVYIEGAGTTIWIASIDSASELSPSDFLLL